MTDKRREPHKFVQKSYDRSDTWAITKFKDHLKDRGYNIKEKVSEDLGLDITAEKDGKTEYFEIETKTGYPFTDEKSYRFDTVSFLARKKKWADLGFWYIIICRETLAFLMCKSKEIYKDKYLEELDIDSAERKGKDTFYRVPKNKCHWYKLKK